MGYPESDRKQLFYQWIRNRQSFIWGLWVYTDGIWWNTYITVLEARELCENDREDIYNMLAEQTGLNWRAYGLVQL
jgi:hypothetical protein